MNIHFMYIAYYFALVSYYFDEVPIGAVIVKNGKIISVGFNLKEKFNCSLYHAEIMAIRYAQYKLNNWRLNDCDIYVTLDPCPMCASAIKQARISNVYSALENSDSNNFSIINDIFMSDSTNKKVNFYSNLYVDNSYKLLSEFFSNKRKKD